MDLVAIITEQKWTWLPKEWNKKWTWLPKEWNKKNGPGCKKNGTKMDLIAKRMEQKWTWLQKRTHNQE